MFRYFKIRRLIKAISQAWHESGTEHAVEQLAAIGRPAVPALLRFIAADATTFRGGAAERALVKMGPPAVPAIIAALRNRKYTQRYGMVKTLGETGDPRAFDPLMEALREKELRWGAARALGRLGDVRATDALLATLSDSDEHVRSSAAEALGLLARGRPMDQRVEDALMRTLADRSDWVHSAAIQALGKAGRSAKILDALIACLKNPRNNEHWILEALAKHLDPRAAGALAPLVREGNPRAKQAIALLKTILQGSISRVSAADLRTIAALKEITVVVAWTDLACTREEGIRSVPSDWDTLGVTELVQLARQELIRRGETA